MLTETKYRKYGKPVVEESLPEENLSLEPSQEDINEVFDHYCDKGIFRHREMTVKLNRIIRARLHAYLKEEVKQAIDNYATMYHDKDYLYCEYKWTLARLMCCEDMPDFLDDGVKWHNYLKFKDKQNNTSPTATVTEVKEEEQLPTVETILLSDFDKQYAECLNHLKSMPYDEYINTDHWQHFRSEAVKFAHGTCQLCGNTKTMLDVHHRTYTNRGRETFLDVIVLCRGCHDMFHQAKDADDCARCEGEPGEHVIAQ